MILSPGGPDIPELLLRSQRAGEVMFIVGAGVSRAAGLPLFGELVTLVYERLGQRLPGQAGSLATAAEAEALAAGQFDRLIGLLEQRVIYRGAEWRQPINRVRDEVAELVRPKPRATFSAHRDLLDLSRGINGVPRIVTTNFDTVFERSWFRATGHKLPSHAGAAMPMVGSSDFTGVMHIHGRISDRGLGLPTTELVLSAPNFGEAYMRSGWASRIVYDLLRRYTVVLVGYSADDPPMRYMLEATEEGRSNFPDLKAAYALVASGGADAGSLREAWKAKGLEPLIFDSTQGFGPLYDTLRVWAEMVRDPLAWSERRLKEIASVPYAAASEAAQQDFKFLSTEVSSVVVATRKAEDPNWIQALSGASGELDDWSYLVWFRDRLNNAEAARFAVRASSAVKLQLAEAVSLLLRRRDVTLEEPFALFWQLFMQAYGHRPDSIFGRQRLAGVMRIGHIRDFVAQVQPRLAAEERISYFDGESSPEPHTIHDLAHFYFVTRNSDWKKLVDKWPEDAGLEERLLGALDRALLDALDLAAEAGLMLPNGDLVSFDVALVHAPEAGEGLVEENDRHVANCRLNNPDGHNTRFAPIIRSMTALWLRLSARAPENAARLAAGWASRDQLIFKRVAAWAAIAAPSGPARQMTEYLGTVTRRRFWSSDNCPEIARFYCKRWNQLPLATRARIERAIISGFDAETIRRRARPQHRAYLKALYTARELARIRTAGGRLSRPTKAHLTALYRRFDELPREMPIYAHLYNPSWSGSGYSADTSVVADVAEEQLLESVERYEEANRWEQADLWRVLVQNEPCRAFGALRRAQGEGVFAPERWHPLLSMYTRGADVGGREALPDEAAVLESILQADDEHLHQLRYAIASVLSHRAETPTGESLSLTLRLWDRFYSLLRAENATEEQEKALFEASLSHPIGDLTAALIVLQGRMPRKAKGGFDPRLAQRFDELMQLEGRAGEVAVAALLRQLSFLDWLSPRWVKSNLLPLLKAGTPLSFDLMSVVANSNAMQVPRIFNALKQPLLTALEREGFDNDAREQLSGALLTAAFEIIAGSRRYKLTNLDVRHALTRMPNKALASAAWELGTLSRHEPEENRGAFWQTTIEPFLRDFWPNDVAARSPDVSANLGRLPALAGDAFPQAVEVVLGLVRPIALHEVMYGLGLDESSHLVSAYPRAALSLVASMIKLDEAAPYDLSGLINTLIEADEGIVAEPALWRLRRLLRPS